MNNSSDHENGRAPLLSGPVPPIASDNRVENRKEKPEELSSIRLAAVLDSVWASYSDIRRSWRRRREVRAQDMAVPSLLQ